MRSSDLRFDHAVIAVRDLGVAEEQFRALGFHLVPGGEHAGGWTRNSLIPLADGSYLELLAPASEEAARRLAASHAAGTLGPLLRDASPFARYFALHLAHLPGQAWSKLVDFALVADDLDRVLERCRKGGLILEGPLPGERHRPDGQRLAWRLALPQRAEPAHAGLPFLIADHTPRALRVPAAPTHPNGSRGVAAVIASMIGEPTDLEGWTFAMETLLGVPADRVSATETAFRIAGSTVLGRSISRTAGEQPRRPQLYLQLSQGQGQAPQEFSAYCFGA